MPEQEHIGCSRLIDALDEAVQAGDQVAITRAVESALCRLITQEKVALPSALCATANDSYARRLIHHNPQLDYTALAMVWGPNQGTPLHDHNNLWCVEGVIEGTIEITQYDLLEQDGARYRFAAEDTIHAGVGSAGRLIPPFDYHTIANASATEKAVTIHVYGGEMLECSIFTPRENGWFDRHQRQLSYTAA